MNDLIQVRYYFSEGKLYITEFIFNRKNSIVNGYIYDPTEHNNASFYRAYKNIEEINSFDGTSLLANCKIINYD